MFMLESEAPASMLFFAGGGRPWLISALRRSWRPSRKIGFLFKHALHELHHVSVIF